MALKQRIVTLVESMKRRVSDHLTYIKYRKQFKQYLMINGYDTKKAIGEEEYIRVWKQLSDRVEPFSYRLFRNYCGNNPYIIPEDIGQTIIERVLNPLQFRKVYTDKNMFPIFVGTECVPKTVVCRINGGCLLDGNYRVVSDDDLPHILDRYGTLIIKPTVGGCSGRGVEKFVRGESGFEPPLSINIIKKYGGDFCLQEVIKQSPFLEGFCKTAVNTIRLVTYRSVRDDKVKVTAGVLRIGKEGNAVDNIHSGGRYVGIDVKTGQLGNLLYTADGQSTEIWNDVNFKNNTFVIPNWDKIIEFSIRVGERILHHRLLALDVALDEKNQPKLIEYNIGGFSYWLFLFTGQNVFGDETQDVIEYCKLRNKK